MAGFFDYLRMAMGWWSAVPSAPTVPDRACFSVTLEVPSATLATELPRADVELTDCCQVR